jgi:hypothetical protein
MLDWFRQLSETTQGLIVSAVLGAATFGRLKYLATSLLFAMCLLAAISEAARETARRIEASELGDRWPLTVREGEIACIRGPKGSGGRADVVVFRSGGIAYALNRAAKRQGHPRIDPISKADPARPDLPVNLSPLIYLALRECK